MSTPTVSVIIPAYNSAWCIRKAVDSVLGQTFNDFEIIVVNDGSTDDTAAVLQEYGDKLRVFEKPNGGMCHTRNFGIKKAVGEFVAFLDTDDYWYNTRLEKQVSLLRENPQIGFCSATVDLKTIEGKQLGQWACPETKEEDLLHILFGENGSVAGGASSVVVRRDILMQTDLFDENIGGVEDSDLWIRLAAITQYACIPEPLGVVTKREGSVSGNYEAMRRAATIVMKKNRDLLGKDRGAYWRYSYANVLADYAKWAYREKRYKNAFIDIVHALFLSPIKRGRLIISLMLAMLLGQKI